MKKILLITLGCILGLYQPLNAQDAENVVNGHEYVDLALPSGLKWATCNVGASKPEACGSYFAWGETKLKDEYTSGNNLTYGKEIDDISGNAQYDVAAANWGEGWRMPTKDEMQELIDNCDWEWTKQNNVKGYKVTGVNGNSIFIPETGYWSKSTYESGSSFHSGSCGYSAYWSSSPSGNSRTNTLFIKSSSYGVASDDRYYGYSIRPVRDREDVIEAPFVAAMVEHYTDVTAIIKTYVASPGAEITERGFYYGTNPEPAETDNKVVLGSEIRYITKALLDLTPNTTYYIKSYATNSEGTSYSEVVSFTTLENPKEYEYVDLGLPSGLKWATHNIGATSPSEYGNYYAWGEVFTKDKYTEANSLTYGKPMDDISGTEYDAATINWGGEWRMPTRTEMQELLDNCTWTWTTRGYKVTSKTNGNSIFLPAAGYRDGSSLDNAGGYGYYLSSSHDRNINALYLFFSSSSSPYVSYYNRSNGYSIRPVIEVVEKPTVSASVEKYTDLTAIIKTFVSSSSAITERGFYYGTNPEPAETDNKIVLENEEGYIIKALLDLTPNTTYYVKAYATNSEGTSYSEVVSFTTLENPKEYEYVDLGLPSGLKWATHNIGATTPEEYGNYYAWGEVLTKETYTEANSETYGKPMDDISGTEYDAATINWSGEWRMPTDAEMQELIDNCTWTWTIQKGVYGYKVTSKTNGNSIFLPAAGYRDGASLNSAGSSGHYLSSSSYNISTADFLRLSSTYHGVINKDRNYGYSIRPVIEVEEKTTVSASVENYTDKTAIIKTLVSSSAEIIERGFYYGTNPEPAETDNKVVSENEVGYISNTLINLTPNTTYYIKSYATDSEGTSYSEVVSFTTLENPKEYEYVDLGLPSGLKWATHNIGATSPEEYGDYFAWGEVFTKDEYTEANSLTYGKPMDDISGTQYDAATINWGGDWRMPTETEMQELIDYCTCTWTTQNGVYGFKVTSKTNGNSIFLPAAGNRSGSLLYDAGGHGSYWSSVPYENGDDGAYGLHINSVIHGMYGYYRYYGRSVRPVLE